MISSEPTSLGSVRVQRIAFFAVFARNHDECLVTNRGPFYGLPAAAISGEEPSIPEFKAAVAELAYTASGRNCGFRRMTEFDRDWAGQPAHFIIYEVRDTVVISRLGRGRLVQPEVNPGFGLPDISIEKLVAARRHADAPVLQPVAAA